MSLIVDSNILVKLVTAEPGSKEARNFITSSLKEGVSLYTVDIALAEGLNALWKHAMVHKDLKIEDVKSAVQDLTTIYDRMNILSSRELSEEAMNIALIQNVVIYDSLYIAAARKLKATIYTADRKLHNASSSFVDSELLQVEEKY